VSSLSAGERVTHTSQPGRHAYLFVTAGSATVNGQRVGTGDQARIKDETALHIEAAESAEFMLIDLV